MTVNVKGMIRCFSIPNTPVATPRSDPTPRESARPVARRAGAPTGPATRAEVQVLPGRVGQVKSPCVALPSAAASIVSPRSPEHGAVGMPRPSGSACLEAGARLWIPCDKQVWRAGLVLGHNNELVDGCWKQRAIVEVQEYQGKARVIIDVDAVTAEGRSYLTFSGDPLSMQKAQTIKDLSLLPSLTEPEILQALRMRYAGKNIYTFAGPILLAINPFEELPDLYNNHQLRKFADLPQGCPCPNPHIFAIAREAVMSVQNSTMSQTILVSGESGAGKTESAKFVIRFLALSGGQKPQADDLTMEHRVLESVPLLEALGNARTTINDNSSRFGKFIELQFQHEPGVLTPCVMDAVTHTYLLETVRVTELNEGERCFHIFYQILAAAARAKRMLVVDDLAPQAAHGNHCVLQTIPECAVNSTCLQLSSSVPGLEIVDHGEWTPKHFEFLARSSYEWRMPWVDEAKQFDRTIEAMRAFNVTDDEISQVVGAIVGLLHLGNIKFQSLPGNSEAAEILTESDLDPLSLASGLLGVCREDLATALCTRMLQVPGKNKTQVLTRKRTISQAADCRDALARHLYGLVFAYIVARINGALSGRGHSTSPLPSIGVLDIFGFEVFEKNCFEQLCINFANEILQQHFNKVIIEHEMELYKAEGIDCEVHADMVSTAFAQQRLHDSGLCPGIFPLLDDECSLAGGTAQSWLSKVEKRYGTCKAFVRPKAFSANFILHHFAGPVEYCAAAFLPKNRDTLSAEAMECMQGSSKTVLRQQFNAHGRTFGTTVSLTGRVLRAKAHSVSSDFRVQLDRLMKNIQATRPHFVRCMKPNHAGAADVFDGFSILKQLRYQGVLEAVRVARAGYGFRLGHEQAVKTYRMLTPSGFCTCLDGFVRRNLYDEAAKVLFACLKQEIPEIPTEGIQVGKTMTFFKTAATEVLGIHVCRRREAAALRIQAVFRKWQCSHQFAAIRGAALRLQSVQRGRQARLSFGRRQKAALSVQTWRRSHSQRLHYQSVLKAVLIIQRWFGRYQASHKHMGCESSAHSGGQSSTNCDISASFTSASTEEILQEPVADDAWVNAQRRLETEDFMDTRRTLTRQTSENSSLLSFDDCHSQTSFLIALTDESTSGSAEIDNGLTSSSEDVLSRCTWVLGEPGPQEPSIQKLDNQSHDSTRDISQENKQAITQCKSMNAAVHAARVQVERNKALLRHELHTSQANCQRAESHKNFGKATPSVTSSIRKESVTHKVPRTSELLKYVQGHSNSRVEAEASMPTIPVPMGDSMNKQVATSPLGSAKRRRVPNVDSCSLHGLHSELANSIEAALSVFAKGDANSKTGNQEGQHQQHQSDVAHSMATALSDLKLDDARQSRSSSSTPLRLRPVGPPRSVPASPMTSARQLRAGNVSAPGTPKSVSRNPSGAIIRMTSTPSYPERPQTMCHVTRSSSRGCSMELPILGGSSVNLAPAGGSMTVSMAGGSVELAAAAGVSTTFSMAGGNVELPAAAGASRTFSMAGGSVDLPAAAGVTTEMQKKVVIRTSAIASPVTSPMASPSSATRPLGSLAPAHTTAVLRSISGRPAPVRATAATPMRSRGTQAQPQLTTPLVTNANTPTPNMSADSKFSRQPWAQRTPLAPAVSCQAPVLFPQSYGQALLAPARAHHIIACHQDERAFASRDGAQHRASESWQGA